MIHPLIHLHSERDVSWREIKSANTYTVYAHTYTHTHKYVHTHTNTHALKYTYTHKHTYAQTHAHTYKHTCAHKHIHTHTHVRHTRTSTNTHRHLFLLFYVLYLSRASISSHICALVRPVRFKAVRWLSVGHSASVSKYLMGFGLI